MQKLPKQVQAEAALAVSRQKVGRGKGEGRGPEQYSAPCCWAEFEKVVAIPSKPQWVVRAPNILHSALMGGPAIPVEVQRSKDWTLAKQGTFPVPEGDSPSTTPWVLVAPTKDGKEPMTDVSHPFAVMYNLQVEALWCVVVSVLQGYGTQFRGGDVGSALDADILQSAR